MPAYENWSYEPIHSFPFSTHYTTALSPPCVPGQQLQHAGPAGLLPPPAGRPRPGRVHCCTAACSVLFHPVPTTSPCPGVAVCSSVTAVWRGPGLTCTRSVPTYHLIIIRFQISKFCGKTPSFQNRPSRDFLVFA